MNLRIPTIIQSGSVVTLLSTAILSMGGYSPAQAVVLDFVGRSSGDWTLPTNATSSTRLLNQNGGTGNALEWGLTKTDVETCLTCTDFNNFIQFDGASFSPLPGSVFSLGQLTYRNASTTDLVNGTFQTVDFNFPLRVSLLFSQPTLPRVQFNFAINMRNTPNVLNDPIASADILSFGATGRTDQFFVVGGKQYTLRLLGFGAGAASTGALAGTFSVPEATSSGELFTASLFAELYEIKDDTEGGAAEVCK
jgi:hypothetical protein